VTDARADGAKYTPKTNLTLSAVPALLPEDAQAASVIERELERGAIERVIDYVWRRPMCVWPEDLTESEARLMDGNR